MVGVPHITGLTTASGWPKPAGRAAPWLGPEVVGVEALEHGTNGVAGPGDQVTGHVAGGAGDGEDVDLTSVRARVAAQARRPWPG